MSIIPYAELHCHSAFSLLEGASMPEALVDRAVQLGLSGLALTDRNDMGGVVRFAMRAKERDDFPAIIGADITIGTSDDSSQLTLLARTRTGYANLNTLVTMARAQVPRGQPWISWENLSEYHDGLFCLTGCHRGGVSQRIVNGDRLGARRIIGQLSEIFSQYLAIEIMDHGLPEEAISCEELIALARDVDRPWVVTNHVHYATVKERIIHDVLTCLRHNTTIDDAGDLLKANAEWHLKSAASMSERWRHDPSGLWTTIQIAEQCTFRLHDLDVPLPNTQLESGFDNPDEYLAHLTQIGSVQRWGRGVTDWHQAQLDKELALIKRRHLSGYFLIMWEIIEFARQQNILVQGRGSAANSAVCYCLGITAVDPIRYDLLFERFLSDARDGYPDIDLDIEHNRREEVIQFVYSRFGRQHAAMVCAHHCFRGRGAVRDTARVLGFETTQATRLSELAGRNRILNAEVVQGEGFDPDNDRVKALIKVMSALQGLPRHRSTHVGGFMLSTRPIEQVVAVEPAAMAGRTIIQWDKDDLDTMKIPKFDLLGLGMLSAIAKGLKLVRDRYQVPAYLYSLPDRQEVYDMIARSDTVGVFQIESRAQMNSLPRTRPNTLYELAIQVALIRPGPLQGDMVHPYIRRKRGEEVVDLIHPTLAPILRRTLGVPLFQEQGMRLAVEAAGLSPDDAERLRRAIGSQRHRHRLDGLMTKLQDGLIHHGIPHEAVVRIVRQIESFSTYGFPESHSTSFALLVYASSWLKCFYPAEFLCALINSQPMGFYSNDSLIQDAQRHGVDVQPPCLVQSDWYTTMENSSVRLGLHQIRGLGRQAQKQIERARQDGPFTSDSNAIQRIPLNLSSWKILAEAGAFARLIPGHRRDAVWRVLYLARNTAGTLPLEDAIEDTVNFKPPTALEITHADYKTTYLSTGPHIISHLREQLTADGVVSAHEMKTLRNGQWARVAGRVISRQRPETAKGFMFVSLEDETGYINVIIHPKIFERNWSLLTSAAALIVGGPISYEQGVWNMKGTQLKGLSIPGLEHTPPPYSFR